MTYLDTEVYKGERFKSSGVLDIRLHVKPTETYQYLPITSAHPKHTFRSIITGETIRHIRNNSNETDLNKHLLTLENKLIDRGYDKLETAKTLKI